VDVAGQYLRLCGQACLCVPTANAEFNSKSAALFWLNREFNICSLALLCVHPESCMPFEMANGLLVNNPPPPL
jgi:hypothetical protein